MPNRIQRLPLAVKNASKNTKQAVLQGIIGDILTARGLSAETDNAQKRVSAIYSTTGRFWFLQAGEAGDDSVCKTVLADLTERAKAEQPPAAQAPPEQPPQTQGAP